MKTSHWSVVPFVLALAAALGSFACVWAGDGPCNPSDTYDFPGGCDTPYGSPSCEGSSCLYYECGADSDCVGNSSGSRCDTTTNQCVAPSASPDASADAGVADAALEADATDTDATDNDAGDTDGGEGGATDSDASDSDAAPPM